MRLAAALLALLATPALAQTPVYAPCLAPQPDLAGYQAAFEAAGWTLATGAARDEALRGPSEHLFTATRLPSPAETVEALLEEQALAHERGQRELADAVVLAKGDMAVAVQIRDGYAEGPVVRCILTAPKLGEVDRILGNAEPDDWPSMPFTIRVILPRPLPGTTDIRIEATRAIRLVEPPEPLPGTEALVVDVTLDRPAE